MTWNYKGEADITLGEIHASPLPKILTAFIVLAVIVIGIIGFIKRDFIYDKLNNPHIVLIKDNIVVQYQSDFDPLDYIDKTKTIKYDKFIESLNNITDESIKFPYTLVIDSNVDTQCPEQYTVTYHSSNHIQENEITMNVTVLTPKDEVVPTITLKTNEVTLYYNHEDIQTFDPMNFIQSISDDKSSNSYLRDNLTYEITISGNSAQLLDIQNLYIDTSEFDTNIEKYSLEEMEELQNRYLELIELPTKSYSIEFTTTDEFGNISSEILSIVVSLDSDILYDKLQARVSEWNEKQEEPIIVTKPSSGGRNNNNNGGGNSDNLIYTCPECGAKVPESEWIEHRASHAHQ